jgi:hypothetical protein
VSKFTSRRQFDCKLCNLVKHADCTPHKPFDHDALNNPENCSDTAERLGLGSVPRARGAAHKDIRGTKDCPSYSCDVCLISMYPKTQNTANVQQRSKSGIQTSTGRPFGHSSIGTLRSDHRYAVYSIVLDFIGFCQTPLVARGNSPDETSAPDIRLQYACSTTRVFVHRQTIQKSLVRLVAEPNATEFFPNPFTVQSRTSIASKSSNVSVVSVQPIQNLYDLLIAKPNAGDVLDFQINILPTSPEAQPFLCLSLLEQLTWNQSHFRLKAEPSAADDFSRKIVQFGAPENCLLCHTIILAQKTRILCQCPPSLLPAAVFCPQSNLLECWHNRRRSSAFSSKQSRAKKPFIEVQPTPLIKSSRKMAENVEPKDDGRSPLPKKARQEDDVETGRINDKDMGDQPTNRALDFEEGLLAPDGTEKTKEEEQVLSPGKWQLHQKGHALRERLLCLASSSWNGRQRRGSRQQQTLEATF